MGIQPSVHLTVTGASRKTAPVTPVFWLSCIAAFCLSLAGFRFEGTALTWIAGAVILLGGVPHGAFDIALAMRTFQLSPHQAAAAVLGYLAVLCAMAGFWLIWPTAALILFLIMSAIHFGEDWFMLDDGLLRAMAGTAVISAAAIGQPEAVSDLFVLLSGGDQGRVVAQLAIALAPVALLVTAVGMAMAWRSGHQSWACAQCLALVCLIVTPPLVGFALYFVLLHSPPHLAAVTSRLADWSARRLLACGGGLTALSIAALAGVSGGLALGDGELSSVRIFQLLSVLAAPHLLLSIAIERRLARAAVDGKA
jgi:beta-carotene 15,15'-dioxygenase